MADSKDDLSTEDSEEIKAQSESTESAEDLGDNEVAAEEPPIDEVKDNQPEDGEVHNSEDRENQIEHEEDIPFDDSQSPDEPPASQETTSDTNENADDIEVPKKHKSRRPLAIGITIAACVVVVAVGIFAYFSFVHVNIREKGAWPNFEYLSTLIDQPEKFLEAVNLPELKDAYEKGDSDDGDYAADIDIDEFNQYIANIDNTDLEPKYPHFEIQVTNDGKISSFGLTYDQPYPYYLTDYIYGDDYNDLSLITYRVGLDRDYVSADQFKSIANQWAKGNGYSYLYNAWDEGVFTDHANEIASYRDSTSSPVNNYFYKPSSLLESVGIDTTSVSDETGWCAQYPWAKGYEQLIDMIVYKGIGAFGDSEAPLVTSYSGNTYLNQFETGSGSLTVSVIDLNTFFTDYDSYAAVRENLCFDLWYDTPNGDKGKSWYEENKDYIESLDSYAFESWEYWDGSFADRQLL